MWKFLSIGSIIISLVSCNNARESNSDSDNSAREAGMAFDKSKWTLKEGRDYLYRDMMLHNIVYNDTVRSLKEGEILKLFGEPDRQTEGYYYYTASQKRLGSWPLHTKSMVIKFTNDSTIEWIKIHK